MYTYEIIVMLLTITAAIIWLADRINVPYPMLLLLVGGIFAVIPWTPIIHLDPELALVLFLPPILFQAAYLTSWRDFRVNIRQITRLAFALVFLSTVVVAWVAHTIIDDISWSAAFVLGAIVSPPDAVAATSVLGRISIPHRIVTVLEGESLVNDASALVAYRFAIAAVVTGSFSMLEASTEFLVVGLGGLAVGAACGYVLFRLARWSNDDDVEIATSLLSPVLVYLLAEELGVSGVLAVVTTGIMLGRLMPRVQAASTRVRSRMIWDLVIQMVNGMVFMIMGIQIGQLRLDLDAAGIERILWQGALIVTTLIMIRFLWVYLELWIYHISRPSRKRRRKMPVDWRGSFVISWAGLRGVVSLATALAIPLSVEGGQPFDHRTDIILISSVVIVVSLLGFGLPLPWIIRKLNIADDNSIELEFRQAKRVAFETMLGEMHALERIDPELHVRFTQFEDWLQGSFDHLVEDIGDDEALTNLADTDRGLQFQLHMLNSAREAVAVLRDDNTIGDEARRRVERMLDAEELRFLPRLQNR